MAFPMNTYLAVLHSQEKWECGEWYGQRRNIRCCANGGFTIDFISLSLLSRLFDCFCMARWTLKSA